MTKINLALCFILCTITCLIGQTNTNFYGEDDTTLKLDQPDSFSHLRAEMNFEEENDQPYNGFSLKEFTVSNHEEGVLLDWTTDAELEASHFKIEHSINGVDYIVIGEVNAAGNLAKSPDYQFFYQLPNHEDNFFRLQLVDLNEDYTLSQVQKLKSDNFYETLPSSILNNGKISLNINEGLQTNAVIYLLDQAGEKLQEYKIDKGTELYEQDTSNLEVGLYFLQFNAAFGSKTYAFRKS